MYNSHIPPPIPNSNYICYADDVTQIITNHSKSKNVMAIHTQRAIVPINRFEYQWKMQTNTTKFQIISAAKIKPTPLIINRTEIRPSQNGSILGLTITGRGITKGEPSK